HRLPAWEGQIGSVPGTARLAVAALAVVHRNRLGRDFIADRAAGASASVRLAHVSLPSAALATAISVASVLPVDDSANVLDYLLPAFAHVLEGSIVLRQDETGMDEAKAGAVFDLGKDERDRGVEP